MTILRNRTRLAVRLKAVQSGRVLVELAGRQPLTAPRAMLCPRITAGQCALGIARNAHSFSCLRGPIQPELMGPSGGYLGPLRGANCAPTFGVHVGHVVELTAKKKVLNVDAARVVAAMANNRLARQVAVRGYPHGAMCVPVLARHKDVAVAGRVLRSGPIHAPVGRSNRSGEDAFNSGFVHARSVHGIDMADPT